MSDMGTNTSPRGRSVRGVLAEMRQEQGSGASSEFVLGHEFLSEAVEFGSQVRRLEDFDERRETSGFSDRRVRRRERDLHAESPVGVGAGRVDGDSVLAELRVQPADGLWFSEGADDLLAAQLGDVGRDGFPFYLEIEVRWTDRGLVGTSKSSSGIPPAGRSGQARDGSTTRRCRTAARPMPPPG